MHRKIIFLIFTLFVSFYVHAQKIEEPTFKKVQYKNISDYLSDEFSNEKKLRKFDKMCLTSCSFVKFKINSTGKIIDIKTNITTPDSLKVIFESTIKESERYWTTRKINGKGVESKEYLLPIIYQFYCYKCCKRIIDMTTDTTKYESISSVENMINFEKEKINLDKSLPSFKNKSKGEPLECIILQPVFFSSPIF